MTGPFEFSTAAQIIFGKGALSRGKSVIQKLGKRALVICGHQQSLQDTLTQQLPDLTLAYFPISGEPTMSSLLQAISAARDVKADLVIGMGGGSALDTAKAVAALLTNPGDPLDYLEVVGRNQPLVQLPAPFVAIPTTAGTGSEVTRNAVIAVPEKKVKVSLRSAMMLAKLALVDPELTYSLPAEVTAFTGMDAFTQVLEPFVSSRANWMTDLYCRDGMVRSARSLRKAYESGADPAAREDLAYASLMGGLALANAGLGAVHGFAGPIGGMFEAPHGGVCAALLPAVVEVNIRELKEREPENPANARYQEAARLVLGKETATREDLIIWLKRLQQDLRIPGLRTYGIHPAMYDEIIEKSMAASSMKANPLTLDRAELQEILEKSV